MSNKGAYKEPWSRQKELQTRYAFEDVPSIEELIDLIKGISFGKINIDKQTIRARALFAIYYLTAARVSEVTKCDILRKQSIIKKTKYDEGVKKVLYKIDSDGNQVVNKWKEEHNYMGIRKKDIKIKQIDDRWCMLIRVENRKNKRRTTKNQPIPIEKEKGIAVFLHRYIKPLQKDALLFPFSSQRATQIINQVSGFNVHFIRHIRATHLVDLYDFNEQALIKFMGWTNSQPATRYIELKSSGIMRQFYKGG